MNKGYFGDYGGLFIPETLSHALNELEKLYLDIKDNKDFNLELTNIYKDYVVGLHLYILLNPSLSTLKDQKFGLKERILIIQEHTK